MSYVACSKRVGGHIRAAGPDRRERWKWLIKYLARGIRWAWIEFPGELMMDIGTGALEIMVKAKSGWNLETMLTKTRKADPDVDQIVTELEQEIADEQKQSRGHEGLELRPGDQTLADPGRGIGPGAAPGDEGIQGGGGGAAGPSLAPGISRGRGR